MIRLLAKALNGVLPIIGVGGIDSAMAAREVFGGCQSGPFYSGFIYQGPESGQRDSYPYLKRLTGFPYFKVLKFYDME